MFFQKALKGIPGLTQQQADALLLGGILCNWWRRVGNINTVEITDKLSDRNLDWHLNHYADHDPLTNAPFYENTPFISVTSGAVERSEFWQRNIVFDPFITALMFATQGFSKIGHVFYAYVFTLGKASLALKEFAEEVRELNIYQDFLPFHPEGEITAKIEIRAPQVERWEEYDGPAALVALRGGKLPVPTLTRINALYASPEQYCNIRGLVTD